MPQTKLIIDTLKLELRKQGITYKQVAHTLKLSEASVKRLFSEKSFTLSRLEQVCGVLNLEIADLVHQMEKNIDLTTRLSMAQESELVADIKLLLMAHFLMSKLAFSDIIRIYDISETEGIQLLAKLDRMKIIELLPGNRVKLMISKNFELIHNGPLQRFYEQKVQTEFFTSTFGGPGEFRIFVSGMFSRHANAELIKRIKHLAYDAHELKSESEFLPLDERFGCSLIMAIRPWEVKIFDQLRRVPSDKHF
jgi:DNA-binding Xre family transcriptional regulator